MPECKQCFEIMLIKASFSGLIRILLFQPDNSRKNVIFYIDVLVNLLLGQFIGLSGFKEENIIPTHCCYWG